MNDAQPDEGIGRKERRIHEHELTASMETCEESPEEPHVVVHRQPRSHAARLLRHSGGVRNRIEVFRYGAPMEGQASRSARAARGELHVGERPQQAEVGNLWQWSTLILLEALLGNHLRH